MSLQLQTTIGKMKKDKIELENQGFREIPCANCNKSYVE